MIGTDNISVGDLEIYYDLTIRGTKFSETTIENIANTDAVFEEIGSATLTLIEVDDN